jgi:hypothetical protein
MGNPPVLEHVGRWPSLRIDIGEHLDGGGESGRWRHEQNCGDTPILRFLMRKRSVVRQRAASFISMDW